MAKPNSTELRSIETILAMFEHEVRSPLNAILGFSELLRPDMTSDELEDLIGRIRANAKLLGDVVEGLSDLRESSQELRERRQGAISLPAFLEEIASSFRGAANDVGLELKLDVSPEVPQSILGSRGMLRVVLGNLVGNAIKFTDHGAVLLRVECLERVPSSVVLRYSVQDTGAGIPDTDRESLLQPFVRGDRAGASPGMGLGLAICSSLLRAWGSHIDIDGEGAHGSAVRFELRHAVPEASAAGPLPGRQPARVESSGAMGTPRVLLVDDDEDNLEVLRRLVERDGFAAEVARDGHTALALLARRPYAIVLTDLHMSEMNGVELARRIRRGTWPDGLTGRPPLVAVTASSSLREQTGESVRDLFDEVLLKPIRPRVLSRMLAPYRARDRRAGPRATPLPEEVDTSVFCIASDYPERRARDVRVLRAFLQGRASLKDVITIGHRLRGASAAYGFPQLGELGEALERAGRAADVSRIASVTDRIERIVAQMQHPSSGGREGNRGA